jgi:hypothetical protein
MQHLPARFDDAGDITAQREIPKADPAEIELSDERSRAPTHLAAVLVTHPPLGGWSVHIAGFGHG